jgi:hypothetical protein
MDAKTYLERVVDPDKWMQKSVALRNAGNLLWKRYLEFQALRRKRVLKEPEVIREYGFCLTALTQYGLSLEVALKAKLIKEQPDKIEIKTVTNGRGVVKDVCLEKVGVSLSAGHYLADLARLALSPAEINGNLLKKLQGLTIGIIWGGRYPVPRSVKALSDLHTFGRVAPAKLRDAAVEILSKLHQPYKDFLEE